MPRFIKTILALILVTGFCRAEVLYRQLDPSDTSKLNEAQKSVQYYSAELSGLEDIIKKNYLTSKSSETDGNCYVEGALTGIGFISATTTSIAGSFLVSDGNHVIWSPAVSDKPAEKKPEPPKAPPKHVDMYKKGWGCGNFNYSDDYKYIYSNSNDFESSIIFSQTGYYTSTPKSEPNTMKILILSKEDSEEARYLTKEHKIKLDELTKLQADLIKKYFPGAGASDIQYTSDNKLLLQLPYVFHESCSANSFGNIVLTGSSSR